MDFGKKLCSDNWASASSSSTDELLKKICQDQQQLFSNLNAQQQQQKLENSSFLDYDVTRKRLESTQSSFTNPPKFFGQEDLQMNEAQRTSKAQVWDPKTMLTNLSFMEQKIHQLQDLVHLIVRRTTESSMDQQNELLVQQQQLITADLTSIIVQLISTAGSLLPSVKHAQFSANPSVGDGVQIFSGVCPSDSLPQDNYNCTNNNSNSNNGTVYKVEDQSNEIDHMDVHEEHESKDEDDVDEGENLPPGSYEILQLEKEEILAPHTHFCVICGKGFKRDANLRMHMRGHGDEYKTPAALAKPHKDTSLEPKLIKRYSCPYVGCKRNKDHKKFQPLKTILCVKNHYKRTHCDKSYTCSRCNTKKFSVIADLKTHEKHCGRDKWLCSCGTTFSRKDKLFGHISLFQGHTPAIPLDEPKGGVTTGVHGHGDDSEVPKEVGRHDYFTSNASNGNGVQSSGEPSACFSPLNMETCNLNGFQEFPRTLFEDSDSSFSFLLSGSCNFPWKNGGESSSKDLQ